VLRKLIVIGIALLSFIGVDAQYITEVLEYTPAPGQFTNTLSWGSPHAASGIVGGVDGSLCLGAWGGYVVFRFAEAVENHPDNPYGVDFTIFGNPMPQWSEPGVVWVMKDENNNQQPDDTWYELAGSDYYFSTTRKNYRVSYSNPGDTVAQEVPWMDPFGGSGVIQTNAVHTQPYYPLQDSFPFISPEEYTLSGTRIRGAVDVDHPPVLVSGRRAFGYADNTLRGQSDLNLPDNPYTAVVENSGGDAFDLHWAVDSSGSYVDLDKVHFVKVQNALQADGRWLGELSTEVCGARDLSPDPSVNGDLDLIVIADLPGELRSREYPLEVFVFYRGRLVQHPDVEWISSSDKIWVDSNHVLRASESGEAVLTAFLGSKPHIRTEISARIQLEQTTQQSLVTENKNLQLFPNPAADWLQITGIEEASLSFFTSHGKPVKKVVVYRGASLDISSLPPGLYILGIQEGRSIHTLKFVKE
jgi:hypothetical protein